MTAALAPLLPPRARRRVLLTPAQYVELHGPARRVDRLVLLDLARHADYDLGSWGENAHPRVGDKGRGKSTIGERIGYSERSVQYALRRLEDGGWLDRRERPGRVSVYRIVRKVETVSPVDNSAESVDNPVDNPESGASAPTLKVAPGGAKVAPDLEHLPTGPPPKAPDPRTNLVDGAPRRLKAAPRAPRDGGRSDIGTSPPAPAEPGAEPHRRTRGRETGDEPPVPRVSRWVTRETRRCPRCGAAPGDSCRRRDGQLRRANHAERRPPPRDPPG